MLFEGYYTYFSFQELRYTQSGTMPEYTSYFRFISTFFVAWLVWVSCSFSVLAEPQTRKEDMAASICMMIDEASRDHKLPTPFFTRLIWQESAFRANSVSPVGAQGIAQFMPATATERGLANPFDPEEAIPKAAELLAHLEQTFGNLGLAAAAYNAGPTRVGNWLAGRGGLPLETQNYVLSITGHPAEEWMAGGTAARLNATALFPVQSCLEATASFRRQRPQQFASSGIVAPWGVQLAGGFSKAVALAIYARNRSRYAAVLGDAAPMVIGSRLRSRGTRPFYRVRAPAPTRDAATALCAKINKIGGACVVLKS